MQTSDVSDQLPKKKGKAKAGGQAAKGRKARRALYKSTGTREVNRVKRLRRHLCALGKRRERESRLGRTRKYRRGMVDHCAEAALGRLKS